MIGDDFFISKAILKVYSNRRRPKNSTFFTESFIVD
jgi:hypothetical protein